MKTEDQLPKIIEFPQCNTVYAKDQPEYRPLPCYKDSDGQINLLLEILLARPPEDSVYRSHLAYRFDI